MKAAWRSLLFVPGHDQVKLDKAARSGADAVIIDLEDGVAPDDKPGARRRVSAAAACLSAARVDVIVRINASWRAAIADLEVAVDPHVRAIMVPKTSDASRLETIGEMIAEIEAERGLALGRIGLLPLIESPRALGRIDSIAAVSGVIGLAFGSEDFSLEVGAAPTSYLLDLPCRSIALAAAAGGIMAFATPLSLSIFRDEQAIAGAARLARSYGCTGALCIHPAQVSIANEAFVATPEEMAEAREIASAWTAAVKAGRAVASLSGRMIDAPVAKRALRLLGE